MISQKRYVNIVSGVGAGAPVAGRKFVMRVVTRNPILPPGVVAEFTSSDSVMTYFGSQSEEYSRAVRYFSFISKLVNSPQLISFTRWVSTAIAPMIVGDTAQKNLASFKTVVAGSLNFVIDGAPTQVTAIDLSSAISFEQVATMVQTAIQTSSANQLTTATVSFNANTQQFTFTGGVVGTGSVTVTAGSSTPDLSTLLGWSTTGVVNVKGQAADTAAQTMSKTANVDNNFGSFVFSGTPLAQSEISEVSAWNASQNNAFLYSVPVLLADIGALYTLVSGNSGTALSILSATLPNDYVEQCPCEILAATDYTSPGASQNYMYYQFPGRNVTVSDDTMADQIDSFRGNYIGVTQSAGQQLAFYQRGVLCGGASDAVDMNIYANEMWLKSAISQEILSLFLNVASVPADTRGAAMILGVLQPILNLASVNGTFSFGKAISPVQQQYITQLTADPNAWRQVQTMGYWINISFSSYVNPNTNLTEWKASYVLVYSKGDAIRFVEGSDVMI